jgi:hypothetical protein
MALQRASYRNAIMWIAHNDDNEWIDDEHGHPSVTACLVADLFGIDTDRVTTDLRRAIKRRDQVAYRAANIPRP